MGAWGFGSFENDDALDWAGDFLDAPSAAMVTRTLGEAAEAGDHIDIRDGSAAVAASEVIAAARGRAGADLPEGLAAWAVADPDVADPTSAVSARAALDRIVADGSELHELWAETSDLQSWLDAVDELRSRLQAAPARTG